MRTTQFIGIVKFVFDEFKICVAHATIFLIGFLEENQRGKIFKKKKMKQTILYVPWHSLVSVFVTTQDVFRSNDSLSLFTIIHFIYSNNKFDQP